MSRFYPIDPFAVRQLSQLKTGFVMALVLSNLGTHSLAPSEKFFLMPELSSHDNFVQQ